MTWQSSVPHAQDLVLQLLAAERDRWLIAAADADPGWVTTYLARAYAYAALHDMACSALSSPSPSSPSPVADTASSAPSTAAESARGGGEE